MPSLVPASSLFPKLMLILLQSSSRGSENPARKKIYFFSASARCSQFPIEVKFSQYGPTPSPLRFSTNSGYEPNLTAEPELLKEGEQALRKM